MNKSCAIRTFPWAAALALLGGMLASCGGGSDAPPALPAAGLYESSGSGSGRGVEALVLDSGRSYAIYGMTSAAALPVAGVVVADIAVNGTSLAASNVHDFNIESHQLDTGTLAGSFVARTSITATTTTSGGTGRSFGGAYNSSYEQSPSLTALAGGYAGETADTVGSKVSVVTIDPLGTLVGSTSTGCNYVGTVTPHRSGNVFDVSVTFRTGCTNEGNTLKGHAFASGNTLYAVVVNGDLSRAVVIAGVKS